MRAPCLLLLLALVGGPPAEEAAAGAAKRGPVPSAAEQEAALRELRARLKDDFGPRRQREPAAVARKLLKLAGTARTAAERYVLLREAGLAAASAGDIDLALGVLTRRTEAFALDDLKERRSLLESVAAAATGKRQQRRLAEEQLALAALDIAADDYAHAAADAAEARKLAAKCESTILQELASEAAKDVGEILAAHGKVARDLEAAAVAGADARTRAAAGRFLCLKKGDWDRGLPLLAGGLEVSFTPRVEKDLAAPSRPEDRAAAGDGWWELAAAETGLTRRRLEERACHWYALALPGLARPASTQAEHRLVGFETSRPGWVPRDAVLALTCDAATMWEDGKDDLVEDFSERREPVQRKGARPTKGKAGEALLFDGRDDSLQCGMRSELTARGAFTVAAWAQPMSFQANAGDCVVSQDDSAGPARGFVLRFTATGQAEFAAAARTDGGPGWQQALGPRQEKGAWCHLVGVVDGESVRLYLNGKLASSSKAAGPFERSKVELRVGCSDFDRTRRFHGAVDEIVLVARALGEDEVKALFERGRKGRSLR